jgi:hypothetical protein
MSYPENEQTEKINLSTKLSITAEVTVAHSKFL